MKNNHRGFLSIVLIVVAAIVLIGGGTYLATRSKTPGSETDSKVAADGSSKPTPTSKISEWKTYTNAQYDFSFKYPGNFKTPVFTADHSSLIVGPAGIYVYLPKVFLDSKNKPVTFAAVTSKYNVKGNTVSSVTVGGIKGVSVSTPQMGRIILVPLSNNQVLEIDSTVDNFVVDQMLPTFNFTQ